MSVLFKWLRVILIVSLLIAADGSSSTMNNIVTYAVIGCAVTFLVVAAASAFIARNRILKQRQGQAGQSCATYETKKYPPVSLIGREKDKIL